jgi:hypothetical protein
MQKTGERGEFFHPSLSPFGYNETVANEQYPLEQLQEYEQYGYKRNNYSSDPKIPENVELLYPAQYSENERKALLENPSIANKIIICTVSSRPFILQKMEIAFYQKYHLPLPTKHPDIRHQERMQLK